MLCDQGRWSATRRDLCRSAICDGTTQPAQELMSVSHSVDTVSPSSPASDSYAVFDERDTSNGAQAAGAPVLFRLPDQGGMRHSIRRAAKHASVSQRALATQSSAEQSAVREDVLMSTEEERQAAEARLDRLVCVSTGKVAPDSPVSGLQQSWLDHHATDLIDRLSEWSSNLDHREAELMERETRIRNRMRQLRRNAALE